MRHKILLAGGGGEGLNSYSSKQTAASPCEVTPVMPPLIICPIQILTVSANTYKGKIIYLRKCTS